MSILSSIRKKMDQHEVDGLLITNHLNRRYLSGFTGSAGVIIITKEKAIIMTDFRYKKQVNEQTEGFDIFIYKESDAMLSNVIEKIKDLNIQLLGVESDDLSYDTFMLLQGS